jgi:hypothetical protein
VINERYGVNYDMGTLFHELFKPSALLSSSIEKVCENLGDNYLSISFRFVNLLGDFEDSLRLEASEEEKAQTIEKCKSCVKKMASKLDEGQKLLVTADSRTFLNEIQNIDRVCVIPGAIGHAGYRDDKNIHLKTFLDFYMISCAKKVYLGVAGKMYKSGFAKMAAYSNNRPFEILYL